MPNEYDILPMHFRLTAVIYRTYPDMELESEAPGFDVVEDVVLVDDAGTRRVLSWSISAESSELRLFEGPLASPQPHFHEDDVSSTARWKRLIGQTITIAYANSLKSAVALQCAGIDRPVHVCMYNPVLKRESADIAVCSELPILIRDVTE